MSLKAKTPPGTYTFTRRLLNHQSLHWLSFQGRTCYLLSRPIFNALHIIIGACPPILSLTRIPSLVIHNKFHSNFPGKPALNILSGARSVLASSASSYSWTFICPTWGVRTRFQTASFPHPLHARCHIPLPRDQFTLT